MKQLLKQLLTLLHISVTRNQKYDAYTRKIIERSITPRSNCLDIGCHKGEILDLMIKGAGDGIKMGFEPIPELYDFLTEKYRNQPLVKIHDVALYDSAGVTTFQHVLNAPAYSGIKKRRYDGKQVEIEQIQVRTGMLDEIIPATLHIDLIKIDVEGAEFRVMLGGKATLQRCKPVVIFEFGMGAAEFYDSTPEKLYLFLSGDCGMKISTLKGFLEKTQALSKEQFVDCYRTGKEYYFVAHS